MFKTVAILAFLASVVFAQTPVRECGNELNTPLNVRFRDCVAEPCTVIRGEPSTTYIRFESPVNSTTLTPQLRGTWLGITADITIPEDQQNACNRLENEDTCPVVEGIVYDYQFTLAPAMSDPLVTAEQEFILMGDNNQVVFCYKLRNTVTNP